MAAERSNLSQFSTAQHSKQALGKRDSIFGSVSDAQSGFYGDLLSAVGQLNSKDGKVKLSNGNEIDINSLAGMTEFTTHIQFLNAHLEFVNNIHNFVKGFEQKLHGMLSG